MNEGLALLAVLIVLYSGLALWLGRWSISMPIVFVAAGFVLGPGGTDILPLSPETEGVKQLTELTLALLLFADASTLNLRQVRDDAQLPLRLLTIGTLLTIALGTVLGLGLLPGEGLALAALLGAILAPTDAALGLPLFNNPQVPVRIRRALNVESGLNDGIATPFVTLFLAFAVATRGARRGRLADARRWSRSRSAVLVGAAAGALGGWFLAQAARRGWTSGGRRRAAGDPRPGPRRLLRRAGAARQRLHRRLRSAASRSAPPRGGRFAEPTEFTETASTLLSLLVWGIFGAVLVDCGAPLHRRLAPDRLRRRSA